MKVSFKNSIACTALGLLLVHILLCLTFIVYPASKKVFGPSAFIKFYESFALLGPFFQDNRINSTRHFAFSYKEDNQWAPWKVPAEENFQTYHQQLWRYGYLKQIRYEWHLVRNMAYLKKETDGDHSESLKILHRYLLQTGLPPSADSVRIIYIEYTFKPRKENWKTDTLIHVTYKTPAVP